MIKMTQETKVSIEKACQQHGFNVKPKLTGDSEYKKNLMFISPKFGSTVYICRQSGISSAGEVKYLKVAVDPKYFKIDAVDLNQGVVSAINQKTKKNRFLSSNYRDFPIEAGEVEPTGKCYQVSNLESLGVLLDRLNG